MKKRIIFSLILTSLAHLMTACSPSPQIAWNSEGDVGVEEEASQPASGSLAEETEMATTTPACIAVDICGAVAHPGVYYLTEGARICDVVDCAGGLLPEAETKSLNQAARVSDGDKIIVYTVDEVSAGEVSATAAGTQGAGLQSASQDGKVNINTADVSQLCTLTGIGESRAKDIIAYRESNGAFQTIEEIMNISGIKEATFSKIKDDIVVG